MTEARSIDLAVIPGDGIGPEIITEAQRILTRACELENITVNPTQYKLGAEHWLETGEMCIRDRWSVVQKSVVQKST